ncbi:MAG: hypothetical protein RR512_01545 [Coprobacillus sp.]
MGFIESLNKQAKKISFQKTETYLHLEEVKKSLEELGLDFKIKNEFDMFEYEVIYNGLLTCNRFNNMYELFINAHYDLLAHLNYEEKRLMFNNDILPILNEAPHFYSEENDTEIYIPYYEPFVNKRFLEDYQIFSLKQHKDYLKNYKINSKTPVKLYGSMVYRTDFSSLTNVYEDERHLCLYFDELKTIYIFNKENNELLNKIIIEDKDSQSELTIDDIKQVAYFIEQYQYKECLDLLKEKNSISDKTYKKILKKYK